MSEEQHSNPIPCQSNRILIVDDEHMIRAVFRQILLYGLPNCRIDLAVNGAEAVESFRTVHHKVIIMDLKMPVMDGETAFGEIQKLCEMLNWEMPAIIFCTGYAPSDSLQKTVINSRIHRILHKPVMNDDLLSVLKLRLGE